MNSTKAVTDQSMTIGGFSRRTRLSLKALRLYDELGLLRPASVDDSTGYRHYRDDQIERARLIGLLRGLAMPLERIARVLDSPAARRADAVRRYWIELEGSMAVRLRLVEYLDSYLKGGGDFVYEVRTRQVPEQRVLTVKRHVRQPQLLDFLMEWMTGVAVVLDRTGVKHSTHSFVIYHGIVNEDSDGPVEVCMAFEGDMEAPDGLEVRTEQAHNEAYTTISKEQGQFPRILEAYDAVHEYLEGCGVDPAAAAPREVYFVDVNAVGPDDPFCDVAWPMTPVAAAAARS